MTTTPRTFLKIGPRQVVVKIPTPYALNRRLGRMTRPKSLTKREAHAKAIQNYISIYRNLKAANGSAYADDALRDAFWNFQQLLVLEGLEIESPPK